MEDRTGRDRTGRDMTGRDRNTDELDAKLENAIRVFFNFLNRHPDRRSHFVRDVVEAGAPRVVVEQLLGDWPSFLGVVRGDVKQDAWDMLDLMTTAGAVVREEARDAGNFLEAGDREREPGSQR